MPAQLDLVDLDQPRLEGQRRFISAWVSRSEGLAFLVDPGPPSTAAALLAALRGLGVTRLDYVLLTHVHLDHAGATADVLDAYPGARAWCHETGRRHLVDPSRLWEGSRQVLGTTAEVYGEPRPVPAAALADDDELAARGVRVVPTPGHAAHHASFAHADTLFVGEAAGTYLALPGGGWYLRPATPPRFVPEVALASLARLLALEPRPRRVAFAHHGCLEGRTGELLEAARDQLRLWVEVARRCAARDPGAAPEALVAACLETLAAADARFARRGELPPDIQARELQFTRQSLRGILGAVSVGQDRAA